MTFFNVFKRVVTSAVVLGSVWGSAVQAKQAEVNIVERGKGQTMVFIPGLNSGKETFTDTCAAFEQTYQCLFVELPGFAGQPPMERGQSYLVPMRDAIIHTLREHGTHNAVLVGHSLGGVLGMMIALQAPELVDRLVLVESLPFAPANQNPALTAEQTRTGAERMRQQREAMSDEQYQANAVQSIGSMTRSPERQDQLRQWVLSSDRATTIAALTELMTTDLRQPISGLRQPVLVLGAWAAYEKYGTTLESTRAIYLGQFSKVSSVEVHMSQAGYHFLTWDDTQWVNAHIRDFLTATATSK